MAIFCVNQTKTDCLKIFFGATIVLSLVTFSLFFASVDWTTDIMTGDEIIRVPIEGHSHRILSESNIPLSKQKNIQLKPFVINKVVQNGTQLRKLTDEIKNNNT
eukprot:376994_1